MPLPLRPPQATSLDQSSGSKAIYSGTNLQHSVIRSNLRTSNGYTWVHIFEAQTANAASYDNAQDATLSVYRDIYDRGNDSYLDLLNSAFRFMKSFTNIVTLPSLQSANTNAPVVGSLLQKINNLTFEADIRTAQIVPYASTQLWKFIFFMWFVNNGMIIQDRDLFRIFDNFKPPVPFGLPRLTTNPSPTFQELFRLTLPQGTSPLPLTYLKCVAANLNSTPFADLQNASAFFDAANPDLSTLSLSNSKGVYLMRESIIPPNKNKLGIVTTLRLRMVIDAYETLETVIDGTAVISPFMMITQFVLANIPNKTGVVKLNIDDILPASKASSLSAPKSFFHMDYVQTSDSILVYKVLRVDRVVMKDTIIAVDFIVQDSMGASRANDFMITPPLTDAEIDTATPLTNSFERKDLVMACNDPAIKLELALDNFRRTV